MAASFTIKDRGAFGDLFTRLVEVQPDNSYPQDEQGYPVTPQLLGFGENGSIFAVLTDSYVDGNDNYTVAYSRAAGTFRIKKNGDEVADDTDLSGEGPIPVLVLGQGQG